MELFKELGISCEFEDIVPARINGACYWDESVQAILQAGEWRRHFPSARVFQNGEAILFFHKEPGDNRECLYRSMSVNGQGVERALLDEFKEDLEALQKYLSTLPDAAGFMEQLTLPVPTQAADRLRIYGGADGKRHLALLYGFSEKGVESDASVLPLDDYVAQFEDFVLDTRVVPKRNHVRMALFLVGMAFALLVFAMFISNKAAGDSSESMPPDVEHHIAAPLYVQPVGKVMVGSVVAARSAYNGVLAVAGTQYAVSSGDVIYHCFDKVGNYLFRLHSDVVRQDEVIPVFVREEAPIKSAVCDFCVSPMFPHVGEMVHVENYTALPMGMEIADASVIWNETKSCTLDEGAVFDKAGMHKVTLRLELADGSSISATKEFPVCDGDWRCAGLEVTPLLPKMALFPQSGVVHRKKDICLCELSEGRRELLESRQVDWGDGTADSIPSGKNRMKHSYAKTGAYRVQLLYRLRNGSQLKCEKDIQVLD